MLTRIGIRHAAQPRPGGGHLGQARQTKVGSRFPLTARGVSVPLPVEQGLPVQHQRAADLHHHFMPVGGVLPRRPELVGDTGAADHRNALVDQQ